MSSRNYPNNGEVWCGTVPYIPTACDGIRAQACPSDWGCDPGCYVETPVDPTTIPIYLGWLAKIQYQECVPSTENKHEKQEVPHPFNCKPETKYYPCPKPSKQCKPDGKNCGRKDDESWIIECDDKPSAEKHYQKRRDEGECIPCRGGK